MDPLRDALAWYAEQARLCRLIHSEGDAGRNALAADGGERARAALAAASGDAPRAMLLTHTDGRETLHPPSEFATAYRDTAVYQQMLYAHPPVAPLTDAQIERIARAHGTGGWQTVDDMVKFARAIESELRPRIKG